MSCSTHHHQSCHLHFNSTMIAWLAGIVEEEGRKDEKSRMEAYYSSHKTTVLLVELACGSG